MLVPYRILLPKWIFEPPMDNKEDQEIQTLIYLQRYPHYQFLYIENGFAVCDRLEQIKEE